MTRSNSEALISTNRFLLWSKVELTICLEVAEHLEPKTAPQLIKCLTDSSDVVLFSAAYLNQGGTNHINEQPHTYWAKLFANFCFRPFDLFRPVFWGDEDVDFRYRQNVFLYVREDSPKWHLITGSGQKPMANIDFMNSIHPGAIRSYFRHHLVAYIPPLFENCASASSAQTNVDWNIATIVRL